MYREYGGEEGASKIEAADIAAMEILADRAEEEAERLGEELSAVDVIRHENGQWREMAGVSPPDES